MTTRYVEDVPLIFERRQREIVDDPLGKDIGLSCGALSVETGL